MPPAAAISSVIASTGRKEDPGHRDRHQRQGDRGQAGEHPQARPEQRPEQRNYVREDGDGGGRITSPRNMMKRPTKRRTQVRIVFSRSAALNIVSALSVPYFTSRIAIVVTCRTMRRPRQYHLGIGRA